MASSVDLGRMLEDVVSELIRKGRYNSRSEILREGVRLVHEREVRLGAMGAPMPIEPLSPNPAKEQAAAVLPAAPPSVVSENIHAEQGGPWFQTVSTLAPFFEADFETKSDR